jgi:ABC-2 type transport system permease protein
MTDIFNIIIREIKFISKSKLYIFIIAIFPIIDCLFLGGFYVKEFLFEVPIAVIDNDNSYISRTIVRYVDASPDMKVSFRLNDMDEMKDLFIRQKASLGIFIPKGLEKNIKKQNSQTVTLFVNASNYVPGRLTSIDAQTIIATVNGGIKYQILTKRGFSPDKAMTMVLPIEVESVKLFNPSMSYNDYLTPGLWLSILHQLLILLGTLTIARELKSKTLKDMYKTAGGSVFKALLGKTILYSGIASIHFEILYEIIFPLFNIPIQHSKIAALLLSFCLSFASISLGLSLSSLLRSELNALKGSLLLSSPAFLLSGFTYPLILFPEPIRIFVQLIPLTSFLEGFRKVYQQTLSWEFIYLYVLQLLILAVVYFAAANFFVLRVIKKDKITL